VLPVLIRPLSIVTDFLEALSTSLQAIKPTARLTSAQKTGLGLIIIGMLVTGSLNWALFERRSLKKTKPSQLRWLFYNAKISWQHLLQASIRNILAHYGMTHGVLSFDDTSKKRSKKTTKISDTHKVKDKATGGYFNGQELVFMVLVTDIATFPVGFRFYMPDPELTNWRKSNQKLKQQGIAARNRPTQPSPDHDRYPTMQALALDMCREFVEAYPDFTVKGILADALYGTGTFMDKASELTGGAQVVSQLRSNQRVMSRNSKASLKDYFNRQTGVKTHLIIRGGEKEPVTLLAARLYIKAHGKRRFVVALKYNNEDEYRYLVASDLSWRHEDIARLYSLRWLVEVFIQDWKAHGGWNRLSKQQGKEGSARGVILSLLCDHVLLLHPEQSALLKNKQPGMPVGCLTERLKTQTLINTIHEVVTADDPNKSLKELKEALTDCLPTRASKKHMAGRDLGRQEATASLAYHARAA
jgi:SRSO17 transposase